MAEANVGFADERYVLINGEHWHSSEKRRPVLLQAWYAQFADILLTEILGNPIFGTQPSFGTIQEKGAHDILRFLELRKSYFCMCSASEWETVKKALENVRKKRNEGTHTKIQSPDSLKQILSFMSYFCNLLLAFQTPFATDKTKDFDKQCQSEMSKMQVHGDIY